MSFNTKLVNLLKTAPRFVDDNGELVLAAVQDAAWKLDRDLVKLLLIILAGDKYRRGLLPHLTSYELPLEGLRIGEQLQFLGPAT